MLKVNFSVNAIRVSYKEFLSHIMKFLKQILEKDARADRSRPIQCFRAPLKIQICTKPTLVSKSKGLAGVSAQTSHDIFSSGGAPVARAGAVKYQLLEVPFKALRQFLIEFLCGQLPKILFRNRRSLFQRKWIPNKLFPLPRTLLAGLTVFLLLTVQVGPLWSESESSREYTIKAGFIYSFTKFIQWPESVEAAIENQGLQFCIAGKDRFGRALNGFSKALKENNKNLVVKKDVSPKTSAACHILFIDSSVSGQLEEYLNHVKGKPTLVVSDIPGSAEKGVGINFVIRNNKTRFEINPHAVQQAGIKISSELLKLGILVGKEEEK